MTAGNNTFVLQPNKNKTAMMGTMGTTAMSTGKTVTIRGFQAANGWAVPTGLGTPNATNLANLLPQFIQADDGADL